uniref:Variant surface glycoprotein 1685 n=1 Tax=Trypanosoma brucei TaxID=5691 RepID=M4SWZ5_9TRYP|nr:variant surface glycoprotein 1685 [Trypanosoma brucei]
MKQLFLLLTATVCLLATTDKGIGASRDGSDSNPACKSLCRCITRIRKRIQLIQLLYKDALETVAVNEIELARLTTAALSKQTAGLKALPPILASVAAIITQCHNTLAAAANPVQQAIEASTMAIEKLQSRYNLVGEARQLKATSQASNHWSAEPAVNKLHELTRRPCPIQDALEDKITINAVNITTQQDVPATPFTIATKATCTYRAAGESCHDQQTAQGGFWKLKLSATESNQASAISTWAADTTGNKIIGVADGKLDSSTLKALNSKLKAAEIIVTDTACCKQIKSYHDIAEQPVFKLMLIKAILGKYEAEKESDERPMKSPKQ